MRILKTSVMLGAAIYLMPFSGVHAQTVAVTVADPFPSGHYLTTNMMEYWMDKVSENTYNAVDFTYYSAGQMGPIDDMLDMAANQVAHVTYVPMSSFADKLPLSGVAELAGFFDISVEGTVAFNKLLDSYLTEEEFEPNGVLPLLGATLPPYQLASAKGVIDSNDKMQGIRLRTPGGIQELAANAVGATAVPMGGPDMYTALQRGTVDATINAFASLQSYKLDEILDAVTDNASFGSFALTVVINKDVFDDLPENIQEAMLEAGEETADHVSKWMDENEGKIAQEFKDEGITIYSLSEEMQANWRDKLAGVADKWASRLDDRGMPGTETIEKWQAALDSE